MAKLQYLKGVTTLKLDIEKCTGCGRCPEVCPHAVFMIENKKARIVDPDSCMECGACAGNCPADAISVKSGVGCAVAVISEALGKKSTCCSTEDSCACEK